MQRREGGGRGRCRGERGEDMRAQGTAQLIDRMSHKEKLVTEAIQ